MLLILPNSPLTKYTTKITMCDDKFCQWVFLTMIILKNPFFFSWCCLVRCASAAPAFALEIICWVVPHGQGNWQTGSSFPTADARQPSSAMPPSAFCLHCFPTCNQGSSSCLSLCCLSARSIWWSWACNLVRLFYGKSAKKAHHWQVLSWAVRPKCWAVSNKW